MRHNNYFAGLYGEWIICFASVGNRISGCRC